MKNFNKNIVLIGLSGCGKTSIGKMIAEKLLLPFYDVDEYIEKKENKLIKDIFLLGEVYFRKLETTAIEEISKKCPIVISTGGGVVKVLSNMETLQKNSIIFFINRPIENIIQDIDISNRPLLSGDVSKIYKLYEERYDLYKKNSNFEVLNDKNLEDVVNKIIKLI
ncbi:shikimate kinase [Candidatus Clostridium radicumherbarum]|uniref:Shikimate kinase n=1 Tax=Candidatus Clostridium radicumherbarum TaxID=3381662 RepID=A0ABW8TVI5_9CLOT